MDKEMKVGWLGKYRIEKRMKLEEGKNVDINV